MDITTARTRIRTCVAFLIAALVVFTGFSCNNNGYPGRANTVPPKIFGANLSWERLGDGAIEYGDMVWDRSFRAKSPDWEKTIVDRWGVPGSNAGSVKWNSDPGDINAAGGKDYTGYVEFSSASAGYTGILQQLMAGVSKDAAYTVNFSSYGDGGTPAVDLFLYDSGFAQIGSAGVNAANGSWTQHAVTITPTANADVCYLGMYLRNIGKVHIDEVRMARSGAGPVVTESYKERIRELGITSLRWPGGTLADWFYWRESVGARLSRGELRAYDRLETPALGLHEFLDLCGELDIEPLITINIFSSPADAAELVEYVLGSAATTQGALRAANGRTAPWNMKYFEIGNEPAESYKGGGATENAGANYAALAKPIISAMKSRAAALGRDIRVSGIAEPNFQLADWLPFIADPVVKLIYNWNAQVFDPSTGIGDDIDFVHGHYYSYRDYDADETPRFRNLMSGGTVLTRTLPEKIFPLTGSLPVWITEYHVVLENAGVIQAAHTLDFQSGLSVADFILSMMEGNVEAAFIWNLSQYGAFGMTGASGARAIKPAGLVFRMLSPAAGEEKLDVIFASPGTCILSSGKGNIPAGQQYPLVTLLATRNASTGRPRIFALNRDYDIPRTITVTVKGFSSRRATRYLYENISLSANNEGLTPSVTVIQEEITVDNPLELTLGPRSFTRIDVK